MRDKVLVGLALLALALPSASAQALTDPGFETAGPALVSRSDAPSGKAQISGAIADGWQDNTSWADVQIAYALDSTRPHGGKACQKITVTRGFAQFGQPVHFAAGRYRASLWLRAEPAQWVVLSLRQAGAPYAAYAGRPFKVGASWTQVRVEGVTPAVDGYFLVNTAGPGTVWLDDADLTRPASLSVSALTPPAVPVPRAFFGLNANHMHDAPGYAWPALDFGSFRTWDSGNVWANIEPSRGVFDWADLDKDVAQARAHGQQFLFNLGSSPRWATADPQAHNTYIGSSDPPADMKDWTDWVGAVVARYRGRIQAYEVWNEPDLAGFYTGTPARLAVLERAAARVIRQADPAALVVAPPISGGTSLSSLKWYDDYLNAGGGRSADVLAYHLYNYPAEKDIPAVQTFRALAATRGVGRKPVWNTESGMDWPGHTEEDAVAFVAREFLVDWALGLPRLFFYAYDNGPQYVSLDETGEGGKTRDPSTLGPAGIAYREVESWMIGARMVSCAPDAANTWVCVLRLPDGTRAYVVWNPDGARLLPVPTDWRVDSAQSLAGVRSPVVGGTVLVGPAPLLLESGHAKKRAGAV